MNKKQAKKEYIKILEETIKEEKQIMHEAKKNGTWKMGLDSNRDLFTETHKKAIEKLNSLKAKIDQ